MASFASLGLKKEILDVLNRLKYREALEVQEKIIPLTLQGNNVVFTSRTGSGKTLAYTLGCLGKLDKKKGAQLVVLVPTRELCVQVGKEIETICGPLGMKVGTLYGGRDIKGDYKTTDRKNQVIVGTPGRLIEHVNAKRVKVGDALTLVYDESDQMFDLGFYDECAYMRTRVGKNAQIILASATITPKVEAFISEEINHYELLKVGEQIPKQIVQEKIYCKIKDKNDLLFTVFSEKRFRCAMVFCNTKIKTHMVSQFINSKGIKAMPLNSDMRQMDRLNCLNLFKDGKIPVLVATDVAARGLQIGHVDLIVNYDVPTRAEFYVHRIGRSGRLEHKGRAVTFVCPEDEERFDLIEFEYELKISSRGERATKEEVEPSPQDADSVQAI
ncbi:MAG: DEAD/DEAH box helicase [Nanoarchaeota archaeon]|nr:DEAD/DEAH box helicase [Nanoarchaeota archaeon]